MMDNWKNMEGMRNNFIKTEPNLLNSVTPQSLAQNQMAVLKYLNIYNQLSNLNTMIEHRGNLPTNLNFIPGFPAANSQSLPTTINMCNNFVNNVPSNQSTVKSENEELSEEFVTENPGVPLEVQLEEENSSTSNSSTGEEPEISSDNSQKEKSTVQDLSQKNQEFQPSGTQQPQPYATFNIKEFPNPKNLVLGSSESNFASISEGVDNSQKKRGRPKMPHTLSRPYICHICNREFKKSNSLITHIRIHTGERPYSCHLCEKVFNELHNFQRHLRVHSGEKPYKCDLCELSFIDSSTRNRHRLSHTGLRPYVCEICSKGFTHQFALTKHKHTHLGLKPFECDECHKFFGNATSLQTHKRIHSGEKLYCDVCNKGFTDVSTLTRHKRIHSGERPYTCPFCNKSFSQSSTLNQHKRIHTGEKPYECDLCDKKFTQNNSLAVHKRNHLGIKKYVCEVCNKGFSHLSSYVNHKKLHPEIATISEPKIEIIEEGDEPISFEIKQELDSKSSDDKNS